MSRDKQPIRLDVNLMNNAGQRPDPFVTPGSYHNRLIPSGTVAARIEHLQAIVNVPLEQRSSRVVHSLNHSASRGIWINSRTSATAQRPIDDVLEPKVFCPVRIVFI